MTETERQEIKKKLDKNRAKRRARLRGLAEALDALPPDVPIAHGPRNQKEYQAMLKDIEEAKAEDDEAEK